MTGIINLGNANNFNTTLASPITTLSTTVDLVSVVGLPSLAAGEYFPLTFGNAPGPVTTREIVYVTGISGSTLTITRAQEGTTAQNWSAGDFASVNPTTGTMGQFLQIGQAQAQQSNYAVDTGSVNHVVATLSPAPGADYPGMPIRVRLSHTNTGPTDMNIGLGVLPVLAPDGSNLIAGDLISGEIYEFFDTGTYYQLNRVQSTETRRGEVRLSTLTEALVGTDDTTAMSPLHVSQSITQNIEFHLPAGTVAMWSAPTPPGGWFECNGAAVSRTTYSQLNALAAAAGYLAPWGPGDGATTFNVPDLRGYFIRAWDDGAGVDPGRSFASIQADDFASHHHLAGMAQSQNQPDVYGSTNTDLPGSATAVVQKQNDTVNFQALTSSVGGTETRPKNIALMFIIKTY